MRSRPHVSAFAARAAPAALIADNDQDHNAASPDGMRRVGSIVDSILVRAADARRTRAERDAWLLGAGTGPEPADPYTCPVAGMNAYSPDFRR